MRHRAVGVAVLTALSGGPVLGQEPVLGVREPGWGAELFVPVVSFALPGLGQYLHGDVWEGAGYSAGAIIGVLGSMSGNIERAPRRPRDQLATEAGHLVLTVAALSAWDAFQHSVPQLQTAGKYQFLSAPERTGQLLNASFEAQFLGKWTTWVTLGLGAAVATELILDRRRSTSYETFALHDAAFAGSFSFQAAVAEEALFRGWLLPILYQKLDAGFWPANAVQATLFGAAHRAQAGPYTGMIGLWALYEGWLTRRNGWSVRESIFGHFWYDVIVGVAYMVSDPQAPALSLPPITIRF